VPADRNVEGIVEMMLDATQRYDRPLTTERLLGWHAALFPTGRSGMRRIRAGEFRDDAEGPMQVVSGPVGRERVHYEAPPATRLDAEISAFLDWVELPSDTDLVLRAGVAHLWFVVLHPFEDGNGRIARAVADMMLARSEKSPQRSYSMSSQIRREREDYYALLQRTDRGTMDITPWLDWFLGCLARAIDGAQDTLAAVLRMGRFWEKHAAQVFNERQVRVLNRLLDGEGNLTSSKWAKLTRCSQDTAHRDIVELIARGILVKNPAGGRSTSYSLAEV
jgi:Fic family protein